MGMLPRNARQPGSQFRKQLHGGQPAVDIDAVLPVSRDDAPDQQLVRRVLPDLGQAGREIRLLSRSVPLLEPAPIGRSGVVLDPALLRPGRFDRRVTIDLPDRDDRKAKRHHL